MPAAEGLLQWCIQRIKRGRIWEQASDYGTGLSRNKQEALHPGGSS